MNLADNPIQSIGEDALVRIPFVNELAKSLLARDTKESIVIGFDGLWGSGKSSVLNLLQQKIIELQNNKPSDKSESLFIRFDPWYFNSTEQLLRTFFEELNTTLAPKLKGKNFASAISKYRKVLSAVQIAPKVSFLGIELSLGNVDINLDNPEKIREEIKKIIGSANTRVIILVDNLDRLDITELLLMFKLVRLCSDFPGFIFVLAFDKQQVINLLSKNNISQDYLEKIIQIDVKLPAIESGKIDDFVQKGISWVAENREIKLNDFFWERFLFIYRASIGPQLITTLRDAKRFLNAVDFSIPIVKGEVDYSDFVVLQAIRVFFPDVYEQLHQYKDELVKQDLMLGAEWRKKEKIIAFDALDKRITEFYSEQAKTVTSLLAFLFPNYKAYLDNPKNPGSTPLNLEYEKYQLISSSTHFDRYFTLKVSTNDIPTNVIMDFIDWLNEHQDAGFIKDQFLNKYQIEQRLIPALKKIYLYSDRLVSNAKIKFIDVLSENSSSYAHAEGFRDSEFSEVIRLLNNLLPSLEHKLQIKSIKKIISKTPSLPFAMLLARDSINAPWFSFDNDFKNSFLELCRKRVHKDILENHDNIFDLYPRGVSLVIGLWRSAEFLNEGNLVNDYLTKTFEQNPAKVINILSTYLWVVAGTDEPGRFGYAEFAENFDPEKIKGYLDKSNWQSLALSKRDRFAVDEFSKLYANNLSKKL